MRSESGGASQSKEHPATSNATPLADNISSPFSISPVVYYHPFTLFAVTLDWVKSIRKHLVTDAGRNHVILLRVESSGSRWMRRRKKGEMLR